MTATLTEELLVGVVYFLPGQGAAVLGHRGKSDMLPGDCYEFWFVYSNNRTAMQVESEKRARVRELIQEAEAWQLLRDLRQPNPHFSRLASDRIERAKARVVSSDPNDLVLLLREWTGARAAALKSFKEEDKATKAIRILASELAEVLPDTSLEKAMAMIRASLDVAVSKQ